MTTLAIFDIKSVLENVRDRNSLELSRRLVQAEITFHESRLAQLKELDGAIESRMGQIR